MDITEMPNTSKHASEGKSWSPWSLQEGMAGDAGGGAAPGTHNEDSTCLHEPSSQHLPQPTANGGSSSLLLHLGHARRWDQS